jgi:hypothetical protein
MASMSFTWILSGTGWADCVVADDQAQVEITASYITAAPEELLTAVTRLVLGEPEPERSSKPSPPRSGGSFTAATPTSGSSCCSCLTAADTTRQEQKSGRAGRRPTRLPEPSSEASTRPPTNTVRAATKENGDLRSPASNSRPSEERGAATHLHQAEPVEIRRYLAQVRANMCALDGCRLLLTARLRRS